MDVAGVLNLLKKLDVQNDDNAENQDEIKTSAASDCSDSKESGDWIFIGEDKSSDGVDSDKSHKKDALQDIHEKIQFLRPKDALEAFQSIGIHVDGTSAEKKEIPKSYASEIVARVKVDGKEYVGKGLSVADARQKAVENAFKGYFIAKMAAASTRPAAPAVDVKSCVAVNEAQSTSLSVSEKSDDGFENVPVEVAKEAEADEKNSVEDKTEKSLQEFDIPWKSLISYSLYKLFINWEKEGCVVPTMLYNGPPFTMQKEQGDADKPRALKALPKDAAKMEPLELLRYMKPRFMENFYEIRRSVDLLSPTFTFGLKVDGKEYVGTGCSKNDAKKMAVKKALHALYEFRYPDETENSSTSKKLVPFTLSKQAMHDMRMFKKLPPNVEKIHPTMLLNQMEPFQTFFYVVSDTYDTITYGVYINEKEYTGTATTVKEAKIRAAKKALTAVYNVVYPEDAKEKLDNKKITTEKEKEAVEKEEKVEEKVASTFAVISSKWHLDSTLSELCLLFFIFFISIFLILVCRLIIINNNVISKF